MTTFEILLVGVCIFLIGWCWSMARLLSAHHLWLDSVSSAIRQLQAVSQKQVSINAQNAEVRSILEEVNAALLKIVDDGK